MFLFRVSSNPIFSISENLRCFILVFISQAGRSRSKGWSSFSHILQVWFHGHQHPKRRGRHQGFLHLHWLQHQSGLAAGRPKNSKTLRSRYFLIFFVHTIIMSTLWAMKQNPWLFRVYLYSGLLYYPLFWEL